MSDLSKQIIKVLRKQHGLKAREIATKLKVDKKSVNRSLHGELESICERDEGYRWYLKRNTKLYFLDFETNKSNEFYLMGYSDGSGTCQVVLNPSLLGLAKAKGLQINDPPAAIHDFLEEIIKSNDGVLVAYTLAEKRTLKFVDKHFSLKKFRNIPYLNLAKAAKKWIRLYKKDEFNNLPPYAYEEGDNIYMARQKKNSLASIMRLTGFLAPPQYGPRETTKRFNSVIKGLKANKQNFDDLTTKQKECAKNVLNHNKYDVKAMVHLIKIIREDNTEIGSSYTKLLDT
jgi:hypothetical protein